MSVLIRDDEQGITAALREAHASVEADEVPVGCVIVHDGIVVGRGHNQVETLQDATARAQIMAIGAASSSLGSWRLNECTMYVALEPCAMCAGAIILARMGRLVYAATDPKAGACGSVLDVIHERRLNPRVEVTSGVLADACGQLLKEFFQRKRKGATAMSDHLERALDQAIEHLSANSGTLHLKAADRMVLVLAGSRNIPPPVVEIVREVPWGKGMAGLAAERAEPVSVCNIQTTQSTDVRPGANATGLQGALVVPIMRGADVVGTLGVGCLGDREFTADESRWLLDYASRLAESSAL